MLPTEAAHLGIETLNAARRWRRARHKCRRLLDSVKATEEDKDRARKAYMKASDELEVAVIRIERLFAAGGIRAPMTKRAKNPFPWTQLIGAIGDGAKALETAIKSGNQPDIVEAQVIETPPEGD